MYEQLGLIGCGLMGGSFALALKRAGLVKRVVGYSKSPSTVEKAKALGVIDLEAPSALLAVSGSDLVLLAVPVAATESTLKAIRHLVTPHMLVMDVGSTKGDVVNVARQALREKIGSFVPAHPIAGKESAGIDHADVDLYLGRQVILTPTDRTFKTQLQKAEAVWTALGAHVLRMSPEAHDAAYAAVSHLPHLLAFAYMNGLSAQNNAAELLSLAGPGFRDFTRIAASDPRVWRDILLANRQEVLRQSAAFRAALHAFETCIAQEQGTELEATIAQARDARSGWQLPGAQPAP